MNIAPNGLEKTKKLPKEMGVKVNTLEGDVNALKIPKPMDILYSIGTLQYIRPENRQEQFRMFVRGTKQGD